MEDSAVMAKQIMIVDDDRDILELMYLMLAYEGYDVHVSTTAHEIQQLRPSDLPDLILLDVKLAEEDGRVICQRLKSDEQTKDIPIIMFSAQVTERQVRQVCPVDDFLAEPFALETLYDKVEKQLS
jgi:DNA-binding response OmpR family regulator